MGRPLKCRKEPVGSAGGRVGIRIRGYGVSAVCRGVCYTAGQRLRCEARMGGAHGKGLGRDIGKVFFARGVKEEVIELNSPPTSCTIPGA